MRLRRCHPLHEDGFRETGPTFDLVTCDPFSRALLSIRSRSGARSCALSNRRKDHADFRIHLNPCLAERCQAGMSAAASYAHLYGCCSERARCGSGSEAARARARRRTRRSSTWRRQLRAVNRQCRSIRASGAASRNPPIIGASAWVRTVCHAPGVRQVRWAATIPRAVPPAAVRTDVRIE